MKQERLMGIAAICSLLLSGVLLALGVLDPFYGVAFGYLLGGIFFPWSAIVAERVWRQLPPEERLTDYSFNQVRVFLIISAIFTTTAIIPHYLLVLAGASIPLITIVNWLSHALLTAQIILGARLVLSLYSARFTLPITIGLIIVGLASLTVNAISPDYFVSVPGASHPLLHPSLIFSFFQQALIFVGIIMPSIYLLVQVVRIPRESRVRWSATLLAVGYLLGALTAIMIDYGTGVFAALTILVLVTLYPFSVSLAGLRIALDRRARLNTVYSNT